MKKYGIVDIGSNSVKLEIYEVDGKDAKLFFKKKSSVGLASYIENKVINQKGINRLLHTLEDYLSICKNIQTNEIFMFATAAIRNSGNSLEIIKLIKEKTGIDVDLISGEKEAELGYVAVTEQFGITSGMNMDIGGASTELTIFDEGKFEISKSYAEGSLSMYRSKVDYIIPTKKEAKKIRKKVRKYIENEISSSKKWKVMTGVGGTIRLIGKILAEYNDTGDISEFNIKDLKEFVNLLIDGDKNAVKLLLQLNADRVHTFTPGALILLEFCKHFSTKKVLVCSSGVRMGYLLTKIQD